MEVPASDKDDTFTYIVHDGRVYDIRMGLNKSITDYDPINKLCLDKGGYLAVPDSKDKVEAIKKSIEAHIATYNFQSPVYLIGMRLQSSLCCICSIVVSML